MDNAVFTFGSFRLSRAERLVLESGKPLRLSNRALDILITLVERAGETVSKDQLIGRVWPDTMVDEGALRVHVAALRKALGDGRHGKRLISNVSGRGYSFIAPVRREQRQETAAPPDEPVGSGNLPSQLTRIIGRNDIIATAVSRLSQHRLLTIVGPGGIGKTTVAVAAAEVAGVSYADGVWFVGLSTVVDEALVPAAIATVFGLALNQAEPLAALGAWLRDKRLLLVLDCCEHLANAAASLAEAVLGVAPDVHILATSREPLRAAGEWLLRLPSLEVPSVSAPLTASEALGYSAVEFFNERVTAANESFVLSDADVPTALEICHHLDGMPLALELAAAQVDVFGVQGLAEQLSDRLAVLTRGRRTALPRHQTLRATIDWSYDLLSADEQTVLRRAAVFAGDFTMDAAGAVCGRDGLTAADVVAAIVNLAMKSLIATSISHDTVHYRLFDTTRAYAFEKLAASGEFEQIRRSHAEYHADVFGRARSDWENERTAVWLAEYSYRLDDLRASLDWAFSGAGDALLGVNLIVDAVPLWMQQSLMSECRRRVEQGLSKLEAESTENVRLSMRLWTALALSRMYTGDPLTEIDAAWNVVLELAEQLGDFDYQRRGIWGLFAGSFNSGRFRAALRFAERFHELAANPSDKLIGKRLIGTALHPLGDQNGAREHIERMLAEYRAPVTSSHIIRFQNDQLIAARRVLAPVLWVTGYPDQAIGIVETAVADALSLDHALTLCNFLAQAACPVAFLAGELEAAARFTSILLKYATRHSLDIWIDHGRFFEGSLLIAAGNLEEGLRRLLEGGGALRAAGFLQNYIPYLATLAEARGATGQVPSGLRAIDEALTRAGDTEEQWNLAELLRIKGELLRQAGEEVAAITCFRQAMNIAEEQKALSWELRAATSLARLWIGHGQSDEARNTLAPVYEQFTEGFGTADLRAAKTLLDSLPLVPSV